MTYIEWVAEAAMVAAAPLICLPTEHALKLTVMKINREDLPDPSLKSACVRVVWGEIVN